MVGTAVNQHEQRVDWVVVIGLVGLMALGALFIASASLAKESANRIAWYRLEHVKQLIWYALGIAMAMAAWLTDYRRLARWSVVIYWFSIVLLVAVLFVGTSHGWGARRWIDFGPFQFQPSEFAKLAFLIMMANYLSRPEAELQKPGVFAAALGMTLLPFILIIKEPDLGSALVLLPTGIAMMFAAGVPTRFLLKLAGGVGLVIALILVDVFFAPPQWRIPLESYQRKRLMVYFGVNTVPKTASVEERQRVLKEFRDAAHSVQQALISVGSGGVTGKGWRKGTQNALGYLPRAVAHNDFIFSVIAEESGFVGSVTVITLYSLILFSGLRIAGQARDRLGRLLAVGVVSLLFCHVGINIGMNIRLTPVTGIPLPLLSYGGTSVLCTLIAIGLLQSVFRHRRT